MLRWREVTPDVVEKQIKALYVGCIDGQSTNSLHCLPRPRLSAGIFFTLPPCHILVLTIS